MEVLGVLLAAFGTIVVVYLIVYMLPPLLMKVVHAIRQMRHHPRNPGDPGAHDTFEIYVSLRAA